MASLVKNNQPNGTLLFFTYNKRNWATVRLLFVFLDSVYLFLVSMANVCHASVKALDEHIYRIALFFSWSLFVKREVVQTKPSPT